MSRGVGRLGYGDLATSTPLTPGELNDVYTKGQFWIPAGSITPHTTGGPTLTTYESGASSGTYTVLEFPDGVTAESSYTWGFKSDFVKTAMSLIITPVWFLQTADADKAVNWEVGVQNQNLGSSLVFNNSGNEVEYNSDTVAVDVITSGDGTDVQRGIAVVTIGDDAISASDWNILTFLMERHGSAAGDTCSQSAFLLGVGVQFDTDFNNIAAWPTP